MRNLSLKKIFSATFFVVFALILANGFCAVNLLNKGKEGDVSCATQALASEQISEKIQCDEQDENKSFCTPNVEKGEEKIAFSAMKKAISSRIYSQLNPLLSIPMPSGRVNKVSVRASGYCHRFRGW